MSGSTKGKFIISRHNLPDPNFRETVVFMIEHSDEGAFGLIINRNLDITVREAIADKNGPIDCDHPIYLGGPVQREVILALHDDAGIEGSQEILPGLFFEPLYDKLIPYLKDRSYRGRIKTFVGYSGWGPGQLESEMRQNTWIILDGDRDLVFSADIDKGWRNALRAKGGLYKVFADTTDSPELN